MRTTRSMRSTPGEDLRLFSVIAELALADDISQAKPLQVSTGSSVYASARLEGVRVSILGMWVSCLCLNRHLINQVFNHTPGVKVYLSLGEELIRLQLRNKSHKGTLPRDAGSIHDESSIANVYQSWHKDHYTMAT